MKNIITMMMATVFLIGCTQQNINTPVSTKSLKKTDVAKIKSSKISKETTIDLTKPKPLNVSSDEIQSTGGGFNTDSILSMIGSALLTGIISGLVSKALQ